MAKTKIVRLVRQLIVGLLPLGCFILTSPIIYADNPIPLYHYGTVSDGNLHRPTAFATWWEPPANVPLTVRHDFAGVALSGWKPGAEVIITVVALEEWTETWPELDSVIGNSAIAVVADRPGEDWYGDAWRLTFSRLAPLWVGKLWVVVRSADAALWERAKYTAR